MRRLPPPRSPSCRPLGRDYLMPNMRPILARRPERVVGIPVDFANFRLAAVIPTARFHENVKPGPSFMATAYVYRLPDLIGPIVNGIRGRVVASYIVAGICVYRAVHFLTRFFHSSNLTPFAISCPIAGVVTITKFA